MSDRRVDGTCNLNIAPQGPAAADTQNDRLACLQGFTSLPESLPIIPASLFRRALRPSLSSDGERLSKQYVPPDRRVSLAFNQNLYLLDAVELAESPNDRFEEQAFLASTAMKTVSKCLTEIDGQDSLFIRDVPYFNTGRNDSDQCGVRRRSRQQCQQGLMNHGHQIPLPDIERQATHRCGDSVLIAVDHTRKEEQHFISAKLRIEVDLGYRDRIDIGRRRGGGFDRGQLNEVIQNTVVNRLSQPLLIVCVGQQLPSDGCDKKPSSTTTAGHHGS